MLTLERIEELVNSGADIVLDELDLGDRDRDLLGLAVVSMIHLLREDKSGAELDDVIRCHYEDTPQQVRGWWDW
ncbi:hypothetical protein ACFY2H_00645 [Streptomyces griseofuscus]|uniref:Uncharacterized protein n=1 Tax=Streptomyces yunnanensis TaxID=156453 RepID=A0A9X8N7U0_9ACTN|nr:hypothetical protein [Streptomyces yunnanensis]SHN24452.1 hypothetical protein SAMN05216268_126103 [Streptomyces yunnanensis]